MAVVCRFAVTEIALLGYGTRVKMQARYSPDGSETPEVAAEIKSFHEATPNGSFEAVIKNETAAEQFQLGDEFYVRLDRVPKPEPAEAS
jgi:hypothetical protein